jgi:hypothetical protein
MTVLYKRSNIPNDPSMVVGLGYGSAEDATVLELCYEYGSDKVHRFCKLSVVSYVFYYHIQFSKALQSIPSAAKQGMHSAGSAMSTGLIR